MNPTFLNRSDRRIVPRWRPLQTQVSFREEDPIATGRVVPISREDLREVEETLARWRERPSQPLALDILNSRYYLPDRDVAVQAAELIRSSREASDLARSVSQRVLGTESEEPRRSEALEQALRDVRTRASQLHVHIAQERAKLRRDPRNAIAALNLAHAYCAIGMPEKAKRLVEQALATGGGSRFVLRAAARFYLHLGKKLDDGRDYREDAHRLLARSPALRHDPWLLAGEIALAAVVGKTSRHVSAARHLVEKQLISPHHLAELQAALGDLYWRNADHKRARRSYVEALRDPTENVVAQVQFVSEVGVVSELPLDRAIEHAYASEAKGHEAFRRGDWEEAQHQALCWFRLEPFSSRPIMLGFNAADVGEDNMEHAEVFARLGVDANPGNLVLHNNLAFALARQDRLDDAEKVFEPCRDALAAGTAGDTDTNLSVYRATAGLLAFRSGDPRRIEEARKGYRDAVEAFEKTGDKQRLAVALARWAGEEHHAGFAQEATLLLERSAELAKSKERTFLQLLVENVRQSTCPGRHSKSPVSIASPISRGLEYKVAPPVAHLPPPGPPPPRRPRLPPTPRRSRF